MANGRPTAETSATRGTRRSIRSTPRTSASSNSRGASRPTAWAPDRSTSSSRPRSWSTASSTRLLVPAGPSWPWTPRRANCCGCTASRRANAEKRHQGSFRDEGLAYWTDGKEARILYVTPGYRLIALDAKTGNYATRFGQGGVVDLKRDFDQQIDLITGEVGLHATPIVASDVVIVGAAHLTGGSPRSKTNVKGYVRGFDVRTGKRLWIFHTIPSPGEFGNDTWEKDSWSYTGNTGVWAQISVDEELGLAYLPVEQPTGRLLWRSSPREQSRSPRASSRWS